MTTDKDRRFTVITNTETEEKLKDEYKKQSAATPPPDIGYQTNPMYQKLLEFKEKQKKKRFTVEDLLKW